MVNYKEHPTFQVLAEYGGSQYDISQAVLQGIITRLENGFDTATLWVNDREDSIGSKNWLNKVGADEPIIIKIKDLTDPAWETPFSGIIRFIDLPFAKEGELLKLKCDGAGYGFEETGCGEEYGSESHNSTLDTLKEIITDATHGIVPKWVNCILGSAVSSGFNYSMTHSVANDLIENIAGVVKYLYFPYKPSGKALNDLCDLIQAIKGANPGPHWITTVNNKLIVTTIGSHHSEAEDEGWTTYYGGSQKKATLTQGIDFKNFNFQQLSKEANYILYHGRVIKPLDLDKWTENNAANWTGTVYATISNDASGKVGAAIKITSTGTGGVLRNVTGHYPSTRDLGLNITNMGGKYDVPIFHCWAKCDSAVRTNNRSVFWEFLTTFSPGATYYLGSQAQNVFAAADTWQEFTFPIGPYWDQAIRDVPSWFNGISSIGAADWANINAIGMWLMTDADNEDIWIDNMYLSGSVMRGARETTIDADNKLRLKLITDAIAKDDTLKAADDSGTIARLAYAELLRSQTTPLVGYVTTPCLKDLLPGQLLYIRAKQKSDGSFNIEKNMRVTKLVHSFSVSQEGIITKIWLTDDVKNSIARPGYDDLNRVLSDIRPEFQDRQASSIKARQIDVTQPILEKSY